MPKKIAISNFEGVAPTVPDHALSESRASRALNVRLTDSSIRPYYASEPSTDLKATLSTAFDGYTNFTKFSYDLDIAWISWTMENKKVSVLETRYNDLSQYEYPLPPIDPLGGGALTVTFSGIGGIVGIEDDGTGQGVWEAEKVVNIRYDIGIGENPQPIYNTQQKVTAINSAPFFGTTNAGTTFVWSEVTTPANVNITGVVEDPANPAEITFTCLELINGGLGELVSDESVWQCVITDDDTPSNTGTYEIRVGFGYTYILIYSRGGTPRPPGEDGDAFF